MPSKSKLIPTALYLGDNGRCFCGSHAGATAQATGRDLSGQKIHKLSAVDLDYAKRELGVSFRCESCRTTSFNRHGVAISMSVPA